MSLLLAFSVNPNMCVRLRQYFSKDQDFGEGRSRRDKGKIRLKVRWIHFEFRFGERQRKHHRDVEIKIEEPSVREDGGVRGNGREVNG